MAEKKTDAPATEPKPAILPVKQPTPEEILAAGGWSKAGDRWTHTSWFDYRNSTGSVVHVPDGCLCTQEEALLIESQRKK